MNKKGHRISSLLIGIGIWITTYLAKQLAIEWNWYDLPIVFACYFFGYNFPDLDLQTNLLGHRSLLTHSSYFSIGLLIIWTIARENTIGLYYGVICVMIGLHLICDLKPGKMQGFATITINGSRFSSNNTKWTLFTNGVISIFSGCMMLWLNFPTGVY